VGDEQKFKKLDEKDGVKRSLSAKKIKKKEEKSSN
jgi:hypothetical protein